MRVCEVCQNAHAPVFEIVVAGKSHLFDSFECALHGLWPSADSAGIGGSGTEPGRESASPDLAS